jgi:hypothetical protein
MTLTASHPPVLCVASRGIHPSALATVERHPNEHIRHPQISEDIMLLMVALNEQKSDIPLAREESVLREGWTASWRLLNRPEHR